jgi:hypothetical protein
MRVAVYARVSTTRQAQAQTIEQQLDRLRGRLPGAAGSWMAGMPTAMTAIAALVLAGRGWTGCGIMRRWAILTWFWSLHRTGWPATTSTRCC